MEKKTIGLLTFHRAINYGAVLQCYALQEVLKSIGYEVLVIDYVQPKIEKVYRDYTIKDLPYFFLHPKGLLMFPYNKYLRHKKNVIFSVFRGKFLNLSSKCSQKSIPTTCDIYIVGSDQLWRPQLTGGIDPAYTGDFKRGLNSKLCGYAISARPSDINEIGENQLKIICNRFSTLSFREKQLSDVVIKYTSKKARVDLDPTLLSSPELWRRVINDNFAHRKYVLLYEVRSRSQKINRELKAKAKRFAKLLGMELVDLSSYTYNVDDFVSAFKYAQVIITSSFHGTAFSVVFEKPFYSYKLGDSVDGRYVELLEKLKLEDVLVEYDYEPKCIPQIDYVKVNRLRDEMKWYSLKYLRNL